MYWIYDRVKQKISNPIRYVDPIHRAINAVFNTSKSKEEVANNAYRYLVSVYGKDAIDEIDNPLGDILDYMYTGYIVNTIVDLPNRFFIEDIMSKSLSSARINNITASYMNDLFISIGDHPFHIFPTKCIEVPCQCNSPNCNLIGFIRGVFFIRKRVVCESESRGSGNVCCGSFLLPEQKDDVYIEDIVNRVSKTQSIVLRLLFNSILYWKSDNPDVLKRLNPQWEAARSKLSKKRNPSKKHQDKLNRIPKNEYLHAGYELEILQKRRRVSHEKVSRGGGGMRPSNGKLAENPVIASGHWKMQPYGPRSSLRKHIFVHTYIKPHVEAAKKKRVRPPVGYSVRS